MVRVFTLLSGIFLQFVSVLFFYLQNNNLAISLAVVGATLIFIDIAGSRIDNNLQIYVALTALFYLILILFSSVLNYISINYLFLAILLGTSLIAAPFTKTRKKRIKKTKKTIIKADKKEDSNSQKPNQNLLALKNGSVVHEATCPLIKKSKKEKLKSHESLSKALNEGYKPCRMCNPQ